MTRDYVYVQLYFLSKSQMNAFLGLYVIAGNRHLKIWIALRGGETKGVYTGGLFQLKAGEMIYVVKSTADYMYIWSNDSYFGAFMI